MRSLADYEGGSWPPVGWHTATVDSYELRTSPVKGTPGVEFTLTVGERTATKTFWLTEKSTSFLCDFAVCCGLSKDELRAYDLDSGNSHRILVNRKVQIRIAKQEPGDDGKQYREVAECVAVGENVSDKPADPRVDRSAEADELSPQETAGAFAKPASRAVPF